MDLTPEKRKKTAKWFIGVATACILIFLGIQNIDAVAGALSWCIGLVTPLLIGIAIAVILNVPMRFFETCFWGNTKKPLLQKLRRPLSFLLALIIILAVFVGVVWLVIPELFNALNVISQGVMGFVNECDDRFGTFTASVRQRDFEH